MNANETKFQPIVEGTKQYIVPLFQRPYSWKKENWEVLWDDLVWLCDNNEPSSHFIGSIVTMPANTVPEGISKFLLIDGQQRLTTIFILLSMIRDQATSETNDELAEEINQTMLINPFKQGFDFFKLLPTQSDRDIFQSIIKKEGVEGNSRIAECYRFFERKLKTNVVELSALRTVITNRLSVVSIVLGAEDNPHLVFESLNAKGLPLTQSDLIRNYFFMRIHPDQQDEIYAKYWKPMQDGLEENLTEFIRHYLMSTGTIIKQSDVYFVLKARIGANDPIPVLEEIFNYSKYYQRLIQPQLETNLSLREALIRMNRLEITTGYPFLLNCYHDFENERLTADQFTRILHLLENYLIRRFVCNYPTNQINRSFPGMYEQSLTLSPDLVEGVRQFLVPRGYPKDIEFRSRLTESKLYGAGDRLRKTKLILDTLEESFGHKEAADLTSLTIEHIMPQTMTESWMTNLGEHWENTHELWLHTIGNLTLTAYNPELSNADFHKKKLILGSSNVELNKYFSNIDIWDQAGMEKRADILANTALNVWEYFGDEQVLTDASVTETARVTGTTPRTLTILGHTYLTNSWRDVLEKTVTTIADVEPEGFTKLLDAYPSYVNISDANFISSRQLDNGYFIETTLSANSIHRFCVQTIELVGLSKDDWLVETISY